MAADGSCAVQYTLPWVVFGGGWESRLKAATRQAPHPAPCSFAFTLLAVAVRNQRFAKPSAGLFHRQSHWPDASWRERELYAGRRSIGGYPLPVSAGGLRQQRSKLCQPAGSEHAFVRFGAGAVFLIRSCHFEKAGQPSAGVLGASQRRKRTLRRSRSRQRLPPPPGRRR